MNGSEKRFIHWSINTEDRQPDQSGRTVILLRQVFQIPFGDIVVLEEK
jgi:hypothetical protein